MTSQATLNSISIVLISAALIFHCIATAPMPIIQHSINGELASEEYAMTGIKHISVTVDPEAWYDLDTEIFIFTVGDDAPNGIIIDEWKLSCNVDPEGTCTQMIFGMWFHAID